MDYLLLKTFLSVCEQGSFSRAAEVMNCVQSNITARIKRLEGHFDQTLFERGRGGAQTTHFGETLREQAQRLVFIHEQTEQELLAAAGKSGIYRLGSMETTAGVRLPTFLKQLSVQCPQARLSLHTAPTGDLTSMVWDRKLDAALVAGPIDHSRFHCEPIFDETLVVARPVKGQAQLSLLAFRSACNYRSIANQWLRETGNSDMPVMGLSVN